MIDDAENEAARRKYMDGMDSDIPDLDKQVDEMLTYARLEQGVLDGSGGRRSVAASNSVERASA